MKNTHHWHWAVTLCSSVALCGTLAAQTPTSSTPPQGGQPTSTQPQSGQPTSTPQSGQPTTSGHSSTDQAGQVTATGCLQRGSGTASSGTSAAAGDATGGGFVLKNAEMGGSSGSASGAGYPSGTASTSDASRTAGSMSGANSSKDINLMADASVKLADHVGHQVTVTGRKGHAGAAMDNSAAPTGAATRSASAHGDSLTVTKVSMVSSTCSTGS